MIASGTPPLWSHEETVLALRLAVIRGALRIPVDDPEIVALSVFLRSAAPQRWRACPRFRNPHGVARKVWKFVDRAQGRETKPLSTVEDEVWRKLGRDRAALHAAAEQARRAIASTAELDKPSHGPRPIVGKVIGWREQTGAWIYLAILDGYHSPDGATLVKIGRTNDLLRRERELNFGLPWRVRLRWRIRHFWPLPNPDLAHDTEQAILRSEARQGRSCGGEFLQLDGPRDVMALVERCQKAVDLELRRADPTRQGPTSRAAKGTAHPSIATAVAD